MGKCDKALLQFNYHMLLLKSLGEIVNGPSG